MEKDLPVFTLYIAQQLIKRGYKIINLAPNSGDKTKVVFYFKHEGNIWEDLMDIRKNLKD